MGHRVTEGFLEVLSTPPATGRVTESFSEVFHTPMGADRVTETFLEVFYSPTIVPPVTVVQGVGGGGHHKVHIPTPNCYDCMLAQDAVVYRNLKLDAPSCPSIEDWDGRTIPAIGEEFFLTQSIVTPAPPTGDNVVVQFTPGPGQVGMLYGMVCWYTGTGFTPGSGDILWRLQMGRRWVRSMGNMRVPYGAPGSPWPINDYIHIGAGQTVTLLVNVPNNSGLIQVGLSRIICSLQGWTWPIL